METQDGNAVIEKVEIMRQIIKHACLTQTPTHQHKQLHLPALLSDLTPSTVT
jgi:hypothetical protein